MLLVNFVTTIKELKKNSGINLFWNVQKFLVVLDKLRAFDGPFDSVDSFDFFTL